MQLMVVKADGSEEGYLHTKVIAAIVNAFGRPADENSSIAGELADAVTFYLYSKYGRDKVSSSEILSIIEAVLSSTGFDDAAANLAEHHCKRTILRTRIEAVKSDIAQLSRAVRLGQNTSHQSSAWNKSKIINDLVAEYNFDISQARAIASMVEEKILSSGFRSVTCDFIKFLVLTQAQAMISAQNQLKLDLAEKTEMSKEHNAFTDGRLRQPQNGRCRVDVLPAVGAV